MNKEQWKLLSPKTKRIKRNIQRGNDNAVFEVVVHQADEPCKTGFQGGRIVTLGIRDLRSGKCVYWYSGRSKEQIKTPPASEEVKALIEYCVLKWN